MSVKLGLLITYYVILRVGRESVRKLGFWGFPSLNFVLLIRWSLIIFS